MVWPHSTWPTTVFWPRLCAVDDLQSADTMKLMVQRTKTVIGTRAFAVAVATVWNSLPADIRTSTCTVQTFAQKLTTFYASQHI